MGYDKTTTVFTLIGRDEEWSGDRPGNRRLICFIEGGGKLAVMGTEDERDNMKAVAEAGFPVAVACVPTEPKEWQKRVRGYTHVVHARDLLRVLGPDEADGSQAPSSGNGTGPSI